MSLPVSTTNNESTAAQLARSADMAEAMRGLLDDEAGRLLPRRQRLRMCRFIVEDAIRRRELEAIGWGNVPEEVP